MARNYIVTLDVDAVVGPFKNRERADDMAVELRTHGHRGVQVRPVYSAADVRWDWKHEQGGTIRWPK